MINFLVFGEIVNAFFIFMLFVLSFFCLFFYLNIQKLKQRILDLELETRGILERKIIKEEKSDLVSISNLSSKNLNDEIKVSNLVSDNGVSVADDVMSGLVKQDNDINSNKNVVKRIEQSNISNKENNNYLNVDKLNRDVKTKYSLNKNNSSLDNVREHEVEAMEYLKPFISKDEKINNELRFDLNEFIKRSERVVPKIKEEITSREYLREVSDKMANELRPQTIELTDYEKEQEEHAIISYQELLLVRDSIQVQDDERESGEFIEELKKFRNNLS